MFRNKFKPSRYDISELHLHQITLDEADALNSLGIKHVRVGNLGGTFYGLPNSSLFKYEVESSGLLYLHERIYFNGLIILENKLETNGKRSTQVFLDNISTARNLPTPSQDQVDASTPSFKYKID